MSRNGGIVSAIGKALTVVPKVVGVLKTLWRVLSANPVGAVITIISALVAGFIYLWNNCEGFREFWINLWDKIKSVCSAAVEAVKNFLSTAWENLRTRRPRYVDCVRATRFSVFTERYRKWCRRSGYNFSQGRAAELHAGARDLIAVLPRDTMTKLLVRRPLAHSTEAKSVRTSKSGPPELRKALFPLWIAC